MVALHIANIDPSIVGGVQVAVPAMVRAQASVADVALLNTAGAEISGIKTLAWNGDFDLCRLEKPFDKPDVVVFHELYRIEYIDIYKKLVKAKIPYVIVPHGGLNACAQRTKRVKKTVANALLFNGYFRSSAAIQYLSEREAQSSVLRERGFVCGNGVVIPDTTKEKFLENGMLFLYIGRFTLAFKGLDMLLGAVAQMRESLLNIGARFYLFGPDDEDKGSIVRLVHEMRLDDLVCIGDGVFAEQKVEELLRADWFIQPSRSEGLPLGVLEALSYGLPCLVTEGTGLASAIVEHDAGVASSTSTEGVQYLIRTAIEKRGEMDRLSKNARRLAQEKFDVNLLAAQAIRTYQDIVSKHKG